MAAVPIPHPQYKTPLQMWLKNSNPAQKVKVYAIQKVRSAKDEEAEKGVYQGINKKKNMWQPARQAM